MIPSPEGDTIICIGTVFHKLGEKEPSQGRLLLFKAELDARLSRKKCQLKQISELNVEGCVYALARVNGLLAAAIGSSVGFLPPSISAEYGNLAGFSVQSRQYGIPKSRGLVPQLRRHEPCR
jgi:DNA damage-binding protein 1